MIWYYISLLAVYLSFIYFLSYTILIHIHYIHLLYLLDITILPWFNYVYYQRKFSLLKTLDHKLTFQDLPSDEVILILETVEWYSRSIIISFGINSKILNYQIIYNNSFSWFGTHLSLSFSSLFFFQSLGQHRLFPDN